MNSCSRSINSSMRSGVETFRLAEMAPEERLVVAFDLDPAPRGRLQLQHLADLADRDIAERESCAPRAPRGWSPRCAGPPVRDLLGPAPDRGRVDFAGDHASKRLAHRGQRRLRHDDEHLAAAVDRLQQELGDDRRVVAAADAAKSMRVSERSKLNCASATSEKDDCSAWRDLLEDGTARLHLDGREVALVLDRRLRAVAAEEHLDHA